MQPHRKTGQKKDSHAVRKAKKIRAATEPLAIGCLDEETCDLPPVVRKVYACASLPLIDHLESLTDRRAILGNTYWSTLLTNADEARLNALLDRRLSPNGA